MYVAQRPHASYGVFVPLVARRAACALTTALLHHARIAHARWCSSPQFVRCSTPSPAHRSCLPLGAFCVACTLTNDITHHARIAHTRRCSSPQCVGCSTPLRLPWRVRAARCASRCMRADDSHHASRSHRARTSVLVALESTLHNVLTPPVACPSRSFRVTRHAR